MRVAALGARQVAHELGLEGRFDLLQHVLLHGVHAQHAGDDIDAEIARQLGQHARGMIGLQLGQDDGDRLRIFVLQIAGEHAFADIGQLVPHGAA